MKRIVALLLAMLLVSLSACVQKPETAPAAQSAPAEETQVQEAEPLPPIPEDMAGSWVLVDANDTKLTEELYPDVAEKGGSMEIDADGQLRWTVGSTSGTGSIVEVLGDEVSAKLSLGKDGEQVSVTGLLERSHEAFAFYLNFVDVDLIWVRLPSDAQS